MSTARGHLQNTGIHYKFALMKGVRSKRQSWGLFAYINVQLRISSCLFLFFTQARARDLAEANMNKELQSMSNDLKVFLKRTFCILTIDIIHQNILYSFMNSSHVFQELKHCP